MLARGSASSLNLASSTMYEAQLKFTGTLLLNSIVGGTASALGAALSFTAATGEWYAMSLTCSGNVITVTVQRRSDGFWLDSSGNFGSGAATAITRADSSISGAGYAGWYAFAPSNNIYGDDWSLAELAGPPTATIAATESHDVLAASAVDTAFGSLSRTGGADIFAGMASITTGVLSRTGGADVAAIVGTCIVAALAGAEHHDTLAAAGAFGASGSATPTGGNDVMAAAGRFTASGSAAVTAGNDALTGSVSNTFFASGTLIAGGADVFAGLGFYGPSAVLGPTESHDVFSGSSALAAAAVLGGLGGADRLAGFESDLLYNVYSNTGIADPINYNSPIATVSVLTWTSSPLAFPGIWRFGVRAFDPVTMLEEENLDCAVTIILDASGIDITNRPKAPTALRAFPRAGGTIRVEWAYNTINPAPVPDRVSRLQGNDRLAELWRRRRNGQLPGRDRRRVHGRSDRPDKRHRLHDRRAGLQRDRRRTKHRHRQLHCRQHRADGGCLADGNRDLTHGQIDE